MLNYITICFDEAIVVSVDIQVKNRHKIESLISSIDDMALYV